MVGSQLWTSGIRELHDTVNDLRAHVCALDIFEVKTEVSALWHKWVSRPCSASGISCIDLEKNVAGIPTRKQCIGLWLTTLSHGTLQPQFSTIYKALLLTSTVWSVDVDFVCLHVTCFWWIERRVTYNSIGLSYVLNILSVLARFCKLFSFLIEFPLYVPNNRLPSTVAAFWQNNSTRSQFIRLQIKICEGTTRLASGLLANRWFGMALFKDGFAQVVVLTGMV